MESTVFSKVREALVREKKCIRCEAVKPTTEFNNHKTRGWQPYCRDCQKETRKENRKRKAEAEKNRGKEFIQMAKELVKKADSCGLAADIVPGEKKITIEIRLPA